MEDHEASTAPGPRIPHTSLASPQRGQKAVRMSDVAQMVPFPHCRQRSVIILGSGYTGRHLCEHLTRRGMSFLATSRTPDAHLSHLPPACRVEFDLTRPSTWNQLPEDASIIWCFPAMPLESVQTFAQQASMKNRRLVVLGSTSAYDLAASQGERSSNPHVDEAWPLKQSAPRVQGEEYLRLHHGAIVLRVAGIYGPGRHVLDWIRQGRVTPSRRYVNLVHVEDLAGICLTALERGRPGEAYNVSDGTPRRWSEICEEAHRRWGIPLPTAGPDSRSGKRISTGKLLTDLQYAFRHSDLYTALEDIASQGKTG